MKRSLMVVLTVAIFAVSSLVQHAQQGPPELALQPVPDHFKWPVEHQPGDMVGVAVNSKGHVFALSRSGNEGPAYGHRNGRIIEFDANGTFLREIGKGLYAFAQGHNIRVDRYDNIWVADKGSDMVVKFRPDGQLDMVFGRKAEPYGGGNQPGTVPYIGPPDRSQTLHDRIGRFLGPADVAWDSDDNIYIADGYYNARIAVLNREGDWVRQFGERGTGPGEFRTLHNIAIDSKDRIYIADRANGRLQIFDRNFTRLHEWKLNEIPYSHSMDWFGNVIPFTPGATVQGTSNPGAPWGLCITPPPNEYLYVSDGFPGRLYKMSLDGKVLGTYGRSGRGPGQFGWLHGIDCPSENEIYVADENNFRVQKLVARR